MALRLKGSPGIWALLLCMLAGCVPPRDSKRLNAASNLDSEDRASVAELFAYHNDQGMLADQSIADIHFVPHSAHLSGTGEARLARYAKLLADAGGTLNYNTSLRNQELVEARLAAARKYLRQQVAGRHVIRVVSGMPGGRGMNSVESAAGQDVAKQPEPRGTAYHLTGSESLEISEE